MATEYELKFKATEEVLAAIDSAFSCPTETILMETVYYDTPSGSLSRLRYTLRRRMENGKAVCTIKTPKGAARGEWETECDCIASAVPKLVAMGCPPELTQLTSEGLVPLCGAKFTRLAKTVTLPGGVLELALDSGFLTGGGRQAPLCVVEVELKSGDTTLCDDFARELAKRFDLATEKASKFQRALMLRKGE